MKYRQGRVLEALRSVQVFLDTHGEALDAINASGARKHVDEIVAELQAQAVQQDGGRRKVLGETAKQRELRLAVRQAMRPLAEVAGASLREAPEFAEFRMPAARVRGMAMVAAAHAMANAAMGYTEVFIEAGLPAGFIEQLRTASERLAASYDQRRASHTVSVGATQGLVNAERRGRRALRILDTLVVPALGTDDGLLRAWRSARLIQAKPGRPQETGGGSPDGPPAVTAAGAVPLLGAGPEGGAPPDVVDDAPKDQERAA